MQTGLRSMESNHKTIVILRCKLVIVGKLSLCVVCCLPLKLVAPRCTTLRSHFQAAIIILLGDACVGKTALNQSFVSGGTTYPKNYLMVITLMDDNRLTLN